MVKVISKNGKQLMPTKRYGKVRRMLKEGKAVIVSKKPFTIRLLFDTFEIVQHATVGVDPGDTTGYAVALDSGKIVEKGEIRLRTDVKSLLAARKVLRRGRRNRNTRYRKAKFDNRRISTGWLPPSIEQKARHIVNKINELVSYYPDYTLKVEINKFDMQKLINPDISGVEYQQGSLYGYENAKQFLLVRENGKCQLYYKSYKENDGWHIHHIIPRADGGTDRPDNLITLCETCHKAYHKGLLELKIKKHKAFKAETIMSILRWKIVNKLRDLGNIVNITYGYLTKSARITLKLHKSHANDAFCIAGGDRRERTDNSYFTKYVRKCNRSLFKANLLKGGKRKVNTVKQAFGFHRFDKVLFGKVECFIYGLRTRGYFLLSDIKGNKIAETSYKNITLLEKAKAILISLTKTEDAIPLTAKAASPLA